jgi:murein tripeptide amidase MpaA
VALSQYGAHLLPGPPKPLTSRVPTPEAAMSRPSRLALALAVLLAPAGAATAFSPVMELSTVAEESGFLRTGRYEEVIELCAAFAYEYPDAVRCIDFGVTPEGRPMKALVATRSGEFDPMRVRERGIPVVLVQGGIHAGEIDGKDAGFLALRDVLDGKAAEGALDKLVWIFVPVFNIDGHERFGKWNRPNQRGPEEMGWRTTAQNYNLNRDYVKADAREMQSMLQLVETWDPLAVVDLHVTDGAKFEHDIAIQVEPGHAGDAVLRKQGHALRDAVIADLARLGSLPLPWYPSFNEYDDPASGVTDGVAPPRFSTGYFPLRNRFAMLVETHSWKDYATRVRITRNTVVSVLEQVAANGARWRAAQLEADARSSQLGGTEVALDWRATDAVRVEDFRGYAYTRTPSEVSGGSMTTYDETTPQLWKMPLRYEIVPGTTVVAPRGGYLVPAAHAERVAEQLGRHGIGFRRLEAALAQAPVEAFRATKAEFAKGSTEGHQRLALTGEWKPEVRDVGAGALFVPIAQPRARLAMAILEPRAPDSMAAWGEFNNAFEQKEYMESYVAEAVAREMLAADPKLKAEFEAKVRDDAAFAADPAARLQFFHQRHASWDERLNLYPVLRTDTAP